jgi:putative ABC transport system permease protein
MFQNYFKIALRRILRNKVYSLIHVLGLTLSIIVSIVIYLITSFEFSFDSFHPDKGRIYHLGCKEPNTTWNTSRIPPPMPAALRNEIAGLEAVVSFYPYDATITTHTNAKRSPVFDSGIEGSGTDQTSVIITDPHYFEIFRYNWLAGNPATSLKDPFKVVLSESKARKYFGSLPYDNIIGKEIVYNDSLVLSVSGIVQDWDQHTDFPYTDFISLSSIGSSGFLKATYRTDDWGHVRGNPWIWTIVKLSKNVTEPQIARQLDALATRNIHEAPDGKLHFLLQPLSDIHFNSDYSRDDIRKAHLPTMYVLMGISVFILLLAIINFINLSTAQFIHRIKEVGVRKVLGSSRLNLAFQFLAETFVISFFAICLAELIVNPALIFFKDYIPSGVKFHPLNRDSLTFILLLTLFTSLLAGIYPAKVLSSYPPVLSLKGSEGQAGGSRWLLRKGLIVFQFSISLLFIVGAIVTGRQISYMLNTDFGFKTNAILAVETNWRDSTSKVQALKQEIEQLPVVEKVVLQGNPPIGWGWNEADIAFLGKRQIKLRVLIDLGNNEFIPFYQMQLMAGRNLLRSDSLREFVINETCMKALGFNKPEDALGQFLQFGEKVFPIVGVVADFHESSFHDPIRPLIIGSNPAGETSLGVRLSTNGNQTVNAKAALAAIEKAYKQIYPRDDFRYRFLDEAIASFYETEQKTSGLMQAAMFITIFISCLGLFGLAMFTAQRRTKEIGIRKVIGASVADIVALLTRDFVILILIAFLIASPISWFLMNNWLEKFAYRISVGVSVFALSGLCAILIALITVSSQAIKAAVANPVKSLRTE